MLKWKKKLSFFILIILVVMVASMDIHILVLKDLIDEQIVFMDMVYPNEEFTIEWIHSVELQPWEEVFRIDTDYDIILDRTRFKSFGAGVPDYAGNRSEIKDGYVIFSGINKNIDDLQYRASNVAKHTFYFKDKELKLYELVRNENIIKIYVEPTNIIKYFILKLKRLLKVS
ncbi:MAG: DUF1850 domain-containing protein [Clostridia bacterium]|nr:DUF1850 domain-containing protein [Clostridia bacterium]